MINVTRPSLPPLRDLIPLLERLWDTRILSNGGAFHQELESRLSEYLGLPHLSLFCNATIALMVAQKALSVSGDVITTPYSFAATAHAIAWSGNNPVFCDVDPETLCLDPRGIGPLLTESTSAIMPLHCYGRTCQVDAISEAAEKNQLSVIYDACHSFAVFDAGGSVLRYGDMAVVSFHATKVFNTFEGGLLVSSTAEQKQQIDRLKNFGFVSETEVSDIGINGKMSELNAAIGLLQLDYLQEAVKKRSAVDAYYREHLTGIRGLNMMAYEAAEQRNFAYFPIFITEEFPVSRDALYEHLKAHGIYARRYFYPLIPEYEAYQRPECTAMPELRNARLAAQQVLCLPLYPDLTQPELKGIVQLISNPGL